MMYKDEKNGIKIRYFLLTLQNFITGKKVSVIKNIVVRLIIINSLFKENIEIAKNIYGVK